MFLVNDVIVADVAHCNALIYISASFYIIAMPSTSALFFFRVRAVYSNNKIITAVFGFLLLVLFGSSLLTPTFIRGAHIGTTQRCMDISVKEYTPVPFILNAVYDTLVFIAISLRIVSHSLAGDTFGAYMRSFLRGDGLPVLSKSVMQGGQLYYSFVTVFFW